MPGLISDQAAIALRLGGNRDGKPPVKTTNEPRTAASPSATTTARKGGRRNDAKPNLPNLTGSSRKDLVYHARASETTKGSATSIPRVSGLTSRQKTITGQCHK